MADQNSTLSPQDVNLPSSLAEARRTGETRYYTGRPCKWGHLSPKTTSGQKCVECALSRQRDKRAAKRAEEFPHGRDPWKLCGKGMKVCRACRKEKPESDYSPDARASDGLQPRCLMCCKEDSKLAYYRDIEKTREKRRQYYANNADMVRAKNEKSRRLNREKILEGKKAYYASVKHDPEFQAKQRAYRDSVRDHKRKYDRAYNEDNRDRRTAAAKEWRKANPEKRKAIIRSYSARRRAMQRGGISTADLADWVATQEKACYWCGINCQHSFHVDHYIPLSRGGAHDAENLVIACPTCNVRKNAKDPYEFANKMGGCFDSERGLRNTG